MYTWPRCVAIQPKSLMQCFCVKELVGGNFLGEARVKRPDLENQTKIGRNGTENQVLKVAVA